MIPRHQPSFFVALLAVAVLLSAPEAMAQTASDVICTGCVDTRDIRNRAVTRDKLQNASVSPAKLAPDAKPSGFAHFENATALNLPADGSTITIAAVTLNAPAGGFAVVSASWYVQIIVAEVTTFCHLVPSGGPPAGMQRRSISPPGFGVHLDGGAITRVFPVHPGANVFEVICNGSPTVAAGHISFWHPEITALFVPQQY